MSPADRRRLTIGSLINENDNDNASKITDFASVTTRDKQEKRKF